MKINLLDPGLGALAGHHFDLDSRLFRALARRGHDVVIHGYIDPRPELEQAANAAGMPLHKTFRVHPYIPAFRDLAPQDAYRLMEDATVRDLAQVGDADLWFWPTLTPYQLAAGLDVGTAVRQVGGTWWLPQYPLAAGADSWAASCKQLLHASGNPFLLGAYDDVLCTGCRAYSSGLAIHRLPCPHDGAPNDRQSGALKVIGFFGHQRQERGIDQVPQLVDGLLQRGFDVVVQDSSGRLRTADNNRRVRVLQFVADFPAEIARCDAILWPSRPGSYAYNLSGVVSEAIASGVPVIVPSGCMPAEIVARYEAGTFFHDFSTEAILGAVDEAAGRYPALLASARAAARNWQAHNGTERLVDWLETHAMPRR